MDKKTDAEHCKNVQLIRYMFSRKGEDIVQINTSITYLKRILTVLGVHYVDIDKFKKLSIFEIEEFDDYRDESEMMRSIKDYISDRIHNSIPTFEHDHLINIGITHQDLKSVALSANFKETAFMVVSVMFELLDSMNRLEIKCKDVDIIDTESGTDRNILVPMSKILGAYGDNMNNMITDELAEAIDDIQTSFGGDGGMFLSHKLVYPSVNWEKFADLVVNDMGLKRNRVSYGSEMHISITRTMSIVLRIVVIIEDYVKLINDYMDSGYLVEGYFIDKQDGTDYTEPFYSKDISGFLSTVKSLIEGMNRDICRKNSINIVNITSCDVFCRLVIVFKQLSVELRKLIPDEKIIVKEVDRYPDVVLRHIECILKFCNKMNDIDILIEEFQRDRDSITREDIEDLIKGLSIDEKTRDILLDMIHEVYTCQ